MDAAQIIPGNFYTHTNHNHVQGPLTFVVKVVSLGAPCYINNHTTMVKYETAHGGRGVTSAKEFAERYAPAVGPARTYFEEV